MKLCRSSGSVKSNQPQQTKRNETGIYRSRARYEIASGAQAPRCSTSSDRENVLSFNGPAEGETSRRYDVSSHPITSWPTKHHRIGSAKSQRVFHLGYTVVEFSNPCRLIDPSLKTRLEKEETGARRIPQSVLLRCCNSHLGYGSDSYVWR